MFIALIKVLTLILKGLFMSKDQLNLHISWFLARRTFRKIELVLKLRRKLKNICKELQFILSTTPRDLIKKYLMTAKLSMKLKFSLLVLIVGQILF